MEINEELVLKVLVLGAKKDIPDHFIEYLLKKLYRKDSCSLDSENLEIFERFQEIAKTLRN